METGEVETKFVYTSVFRLVFSVIVYLFQIHLHLQCSRAPPEWRTDRRSGWSGQGIVSTITTDFATPSGMQVSHCICICVCLCICIPVAQVFVCVSFFINICVIVLLNWIVVYVLPSPVALPHLGPAKLMEHCFCCHIITITMTITIIITITLTITIIITITMTHQQYHPHQQQCQIQTRCQKLPRHEILQLHWGLKPIDFATLSRFHPISSHGRLVSSVMGAFNGPH